MAEFYIREATPEDVVSTGLNGVSNVSNRAVANYPRSYHRARVCSPFFAPLGHAISEQNPQAVYEKAPEQVKATPEIVSSIDPQPTAGLSSIWLRSAATAQPL